ncbi:hypothetical protein PENTCL1PPCAC_16202, partial [Pristionchus entomophagus]
AIATAIDMFARAPTRSARQLIYVITASDSASASFNTRFSQSVNHVPSLADTFKQRGGIIAVTEVSTASTVESLRNIASPGYHNRESDVNADLQVLCAGSSSFSSGLSSFT